MTLGGIKLIIRLKKILEDKDRSIIIDETLDGFDYNDFTFSPIKITGNVLIDLDMLKLIADVNYSYGGQCDRCLDDVKKEEEFTLVKQYDIKEIESSDKEGIDLEETVKEQILLNMPSKVLCKDDCLGLCPECGINLNKESCNCKDNQINPKFAALEKLLKGEGEN